MANWWAGGGRGSERKRQSMGEERKSPVKLKDTFTTKSKGISSSFAVPEL
jgi:hypothetical protein